MTSMMMMATIQANIRLFTVSSILVLRKMTIIEGGGEEDDDNDQKKNSGWERG